MTMTVGGGKWWWQWLITSDDGARQLMVSREISGQDCRRLMAGY
jgi:hypothetical protein